MAGSSESKLTVSVTKDGDILPIVSCFGAEHEKKLTARRKINKRIGVLSHQITKLNFKKITRGNLELLNLYD
jgi:hypothetical protein